MFDWEFDGYLDLLLKAKTHKYLYKQPNKNPPPNWRYFYNVHHARHGAEEGTHIGDESQIVVGAKFRLPGMDEDGNKTEGHVEVISVDGSKVTLKHDETGKEYTVSKKQLKDKLREHYHARITAHMVRTRADLETVLKNFQLGLATQKMVDRLSKYAGKYGVYSRTGFEVEEDWLGPPKESSYTLHEEHLPALTDKDKLPDGIANFPNPDREKNKIGLLRHQIEGVLRIIQSFRERNAFLLQDEAGQGKTLTAIAAAIANGGRRNLFVVPESGKAGHKRKWIGDAGVYNMEIKDGARGIHATNEGNWVISYSELVQSDGKGGWKIKAKYKGHFDLIAFDESHSMKTPGKQWAEAGVLMQERCDKALYVSATPFEKLTDLHYLRKIGWFEGGEGFVEFCEKMGAGTTPNVAMGSGIPHSISPPDNIAPLTTLAAVMHVEGSTRREIGTVSGVDLMGNPIKKNAKFHTIAHGDLPDEHKNNFAGAEAIKHLALAAGYKAFTLEGGMANWHKAMWEVAKLPHALEHALDDLGSNDKSHALLFLSRKSVKSDVFYNIAKSIEASQREKGFPEKEIKLKTGESIMAHEIPGVIRDIAGKMKEYDTLALARDAFKEGGHEVGEFHGDARDKDVYRDHTAFQDGKLRVGIATTDKAGTGWDFHDTSGERPRVQYNVGMPWSGAGFQQMNGRITRTGTRSSTTTRQYVGDSDREQRMSAIVTNKMRTSGALISGNPEIKVTPAEMARWEMNSSGSDLDSRSDATIALDPARLDAEGIEARHSFDHAIDMLHRGDDPMDALGREMRTQDQRKVDYAHRSAIAKMIYNDMQVTPHGDGKWMIHNCHPTDTQKEKNYLKKVTEVRKAKKAQLGRWRKKGLITGETPKEMRQSAYENIAGNAPSNYAAARAVATRLGWGIAGGELKTNHGSPEKGNGKKTGQWIVNDARVFGMMAKMKKEIGDVVTPAVGGWSKDDFHEVHEKAGHYEKPWTPGVKDNRARVSARKKARAALGKVAASMTFGGLAKAWLTKQ